MLFNSYVFMLVFLPAILILWWSLGGWPKIRLGTLVVASYLFYGWNRPEFTALLAISTSVDYFVGLRMHVARTDRHRLGWLLVSLASNLGMLAYFKYCGFFAESLNSLLETFRFAGPIDVPEILLPIGISFYTFQTLSYSIDLYRRQVQPAKSFLHFAAYVSMFPQLIAGPIVRYKDIEDQMRSLSSRIDWSLFSSGIWIFAVGMSQKILVADLVAKSITPLLDRPESLQLISGWYCLLGYTVQLYFDFSGYSNMAIGLGMMLGFCFPKNFDSPYKATSIQDFWRRWHITLSSFLRDYLYFPLGGSRAGKWWSLRNLIIVMFLGGLWHGAGWTFILWGLYHGGLLAVHAIYSQIAHWKMPKVLAIASTFLSVILGWLLFRSESLAMAGDWWLAIVGMHGIEPGLDTSTIPILGIGVIAAAMGLCWFAPNLWQIEFPRSFAGAVAIGGLLWFCILRFDAESPFLYFQF